MKTHRLVVNTVLIGTVLALSCLGISNAYGENYDSIMKKMSEIDTKLSELNESDKKLDELSISKAAFQFNEIKESMLEINDLNKGQSETIDNVYEYIKNEYISTIKNYENKINQYQKDNGLTLLEKKQLTEISNQKNIFSINESKQIFEKKQNEKIINESNKVKAEKEYQKLVNSIGVKLSEKYNGNEVPKIHYKLAINEIIESKSWELASPGIDRTIKQTNDVKLKDKLIEIKNKVDNLLEKKNKLSGDLQITELKQNPKLNKVNFVEFDQNSLQNSFVLNQLLENEITSTLSDTNSVISEYDQKIGLESKAEVENTIQTLNSIIESELVTALEDTDKIIDDYDDKIKKIKEKQSKEAKEKSSKSKNIEKNSKSKDTESKSNNGNQNKNDKK